MNHVYFTVLLDGAGLAAELVVELSGGTDVLTCMRSSDWCVRTTRTSPTRSSRQSDPIVRTKEPLRVVREVDDWARLTPEALQGWRDRLISRAPDERGEILN